MELLIITPKLDKSDARYGVFHRWCKEFACRAESVVVIADAVGKTALPENTRVWSLGGEKGRGAVRRLWKFWEFFSFYYARADAVFFYDTPGRAVAAAPFLVTLKKLSALWYAGRITSVIRLAERLAYFVFTVSDKSFQMPSKKVLYIGHAIDTELFSPMSDKQKSDVLRLLAISRIAPVSDIEGVLSAVAALTGILKRPWSLTIAGHPLFRHNEKHLSLLKKLVEKKGLSDRVRFLASVEAHALPSIYNGHDICVSLSKNADVDQVILESMASGMTVIAAGAQYKDILPAPYFLEHAKPVFLAHRIAELADDPRPNITLRSIVVEKYSVGKAVERMGEMLKA